MSERIRPKGVNLSRPLGIFQGLTMEELSDTAKYPPDAYQHTVVSRTFYEAKDGVYCSFEFQRGKPSAVYLATRDPNSGGLHNFRVSPDWWEYWGRVEI